MVCKKPDKGMVLYENINISSYDVNYCHDSLIIAILIIT